MFCLYAPAMYLACGFSLPRGLCLRFLAYFVRMVQLTECPETPLDGHFFPVESLISAWGVSHKSLLSEAGLEICQETALL